MAFKDLREFIERVESIGELRRVNGADCNLEVGAITEVAGETPHCPMVLFDQIRGCKTGRVVSNLLHTQSRLALCLGAPEARGIPLLKNLKEMLGRIASGPAPVEVKTGPVKDNVLTGKAVNVLDFPAVKWHEHDGGPFYTGGAVVTKDPDEGWFNVGLYRLQVQDATTLSLNIEPGKHGDLITKKYWAKKQACPVAITLGHDPAVFLASTLNAPWGVSEYRVAGLVNGAPVEVLAGPLTGFPVPATSELVFEGEAPPPEVEARVEGPWGEATGYYASEPIPKPVIKVKSIMYRNNPIIQGAPPMKPLTGTKHFPINPRCATLWGDLERSGIAEIRGVWEYAAGILVISLKQKYAGHVSQAALTAAGSRSSGSAHFIVVVDDDIDPSNISEVLWAIGSRCDPQRDITVLPDTWSAAVDPLVTAEKLARKDYTAGKVVMTACKPLWRREFQRVVGVSAETKAAILQKWSETIK